MFSLFNSPAHTSLRAVNILVVDDDKQLLQTFEFMQELLAPTCCIYTASSSEQALKLIDQHVMHMIFLAVSLPDMSGFELCQKLTAHPNSQNAYRTLMSENYQDLLERLRGFNVYAQEFLKKPLILEELRLMLRSKIMFFLHRVSLDHSAIQHKLYHAGHFSWNAQIATITNKGELLSLSKMEYVLLAFLIQHPLQVLSRSQLIEVVWRDKPNQHMVTDTNLRSLIYKVRQKIEPEPADPCYLLNAKHGGYIFYPEGTNAGQFIASIS